MNVTLLDLELRILLLRYSKEQVVDALSRIERAGKDSIAESLVRLERKPRPKRGARNAPPSLLDTVETEYSGHGEFHDALRSLATRFDNREFLPNLRDVQRFLNRVGSTAPNQKLRSRADAGRVLLQALSKLSIDEISKINARRQPSDDGDLAILSRAIMGPPRKASHD